VTVDTLLGTNLIIWEKDSPQVATSYNIYKESTAAGVYYLLDNIPASAISLYEDPISNPQIRSWRYKLSAVDSCGNESDMSTDHKTIHLTINLGLQGTINLIWDHYKGFPVSTYYIKRYLPSTGWVEIDSLASSLTSYTDTPATQVGLFYQISVKHPDGCFSSKMGKNYNSTRSNTTSIGNTPFGLAPAADFLASITSVNVGGAIDFLDLSQNNPTSWTWLFDGGTPAFETDQNPIGIIYNTAGVYDVTLIAANALGSDTLVKSAYIQVSSGVGMEGEETKTNRLLVYPNPFTQTTTISFANARQASYTLTVYNIMGEKVRRAGGITAEKFIFEKGELLPGVYFFDLSGDGMLYRGRLLIN
ncbi:MAG TPA: T9SS type A sorting domain-containing protein, partial [Flavobacteriales bacterium]|nr:T9SS type A sorting domain-containing protein [Flavobacteriales bacterium]